MKTIVQALTEGQRRLMEPHLDALRRAQENVRLAAQAFAQHEGSTFDADTLAYYREDPDPPANPAA